jgi:hypothetical protein
MDFTPYIHGIFTYRGSFCIIQINSDETNSYDGFEGS